MKTAREIAQALAGRAEQVAKLLLPAGKRVGHEWEVGSIAGEHGKSLKICLSGDKAGVWSDFATGDSGDLLDLWARVRGQGIGDALRDARIHLGLPGTARFEGHTTRTYKRPKRPPAKAPSQGRVRDYLMRERRLTPEAIAAYKVAATPEDDAVIFPFLRDGELVLAKRLELERPNGKKDIRLTEAGCEPCLFGWQAIPPSARSVVICEGEIDAMSLWQEHFPALSVPFGGGAGEKQQWIETEFDNLARFDDIVLCFDSDETGETAAREIANRLGVERCRIARVPAPFKDANELLVAKANDPFELARMVKAMIESAASIDPAELKSAALFVDDVIKAFYPDDGVEPGFNPPWQRAHDLIRFRPAELVILNGTNGHGKSQVMGQLVLDAARQGQRCCIASLELKARMLLKRLTIQAAGLHSDIPSVPFIRAIHDWYRDRVWIFDVVGTAKVGRLLEVFTYARRRYGITVFVVDSLLKCGLAESDYDGQKLFVERLCDFKNEHDATVFLVTHARKGESEDEPTGKMDVRGAGAIADLCDTGLTVWRNKRKENQIASLESRNEPVTEELRGKPDAMLYCWKQRNGDWEKQIALWWHGGSNRLVDARCAPIRPYVPWTEHTETNELAVPISGAAS